MADDVDRVAQPFRQQVVHDVDADVLVGEQRPGRAQQEHDAEQHPLQLEPGVRRGIENLAHGGVDRRDHHGGKDQPRDALADPGGGGVDHARHRQQRLQQCVEGAPLFVSPLPSRYRRPAFIVFLYSPRLGRKTKPATLIRCRHEASMEKLVVDRGQGPALDRQLRPPRASAAPKPRGAATHG